MKYALTLLPFVWSLSALATTFTVTTNADSGPGSLRDAINLAAANGAGPNLIVFNIADQSRAGRTIALASTLPNLPAIPLSTGPRNLVCRLASAQPVSSSPM